MSKQQTIETYIRRNGTRFVMCGCLVRKQAYVTTCRTRHGKLAPRVRCLRHHRLRAAQAMRLRRAEAR